MEKGIEFAKEFEKMEQIFILNLE
jgi:hypothetical protein